MKTRLRHALLALLAAWAIAMLTTIPFQIAVCLRNTDRDMHLFRQMLPLVLMIWFVWTLVLALVGWLLLALPIALLVDPRWVYRMSGWFMVGCAILSIAATSFHFEVWKVLRPHIPIDKHSYVLYTVFTMSYSVTMAAVYSWLAGRSSRRRSTDSAIRN